MKIGTVLSCLTAMVAATLFSQASAETVQTGANVFNGRPYLWLEAENYNTITNGDPNTGWKVVDTENPINSVSGLPILPDTSNVSGTAMLDQIGGGRDTVQYQVKFTTAGTYQLFTRHSMYDSNGNGNYGNEDSIYLSPAFNKNSSTDWIGFEGKAFDEVTVDPNIDVPTPGYAADPDGFKPTTGDSINDGWYATRDWGVKSEGVVTFPNSATGTEWNGNFNWYNRPFFVGASPVAPFGFDSDFEFKTEYIVTPEMLNQTLTFEMGTREPYVVMDGFLFIQTSNVYPDQDLLDLYSQADLDEGILPQTIAGDYNGNGSVDAADYVVWRNGDSPDDTQAGYDLWKANFGKPGSGAGASVGAVPEPASLMLLLVGLATFHGLRPRRTR